MGGFAVSGPMPYAPLTKTQAGTTGAPTAFNEWKFQPVDSAKAPFTLYFGGALFNTTWDTTMYLGYNADGSSATEPILRFNIEQDYEFPASTHLMEMYWEFLSVNRLTTVRPFFTQINRSTASTITQVLGDTVNIVDRASGDSTAIFTPHLLSVLPSTAGGGPAQVRIAANAANLASLLVMEYSNTGTKAQFQTFATGLLLVVAGNSSHYFYSDSNHACFAVGGGDNAAVITADMAGSFSGVKGLVIRGRSNWAANSLELQDSGSTPHIFATRARTDINASLVLGKAAITTTATDGFLYLPTCAGTPTGVPTTQNSLPATVYDTTGHKLWIYDGGWKSAAFA